MPSQQKLIFDIETIGRPFESLDTFSQEYIKKYTESEEELTEAKDRMSFSPLTGEIVAIGILNPETMRGAVYTRTPEGSASDATEIAAGIQYETGSEEDIIKKFWETAQHYNTFISFNGRAFDVPFLNIRSAILGIRPTKNLMSNRYLSSQSYGANHIDLLDQLTYYGAVRKKFTLHFWCKAFGIKSPKEDGVTGNDVGRLYGEGKYIDIAKYNVGDLIATKELYERWEQYLS